MAEAVSTSILEEGDVDGLGLPPCSSKAVRLGEIPPDLDGVGGVESIVVREVGIGLELLFGPKLELDDMFVGNSLSVAREETCLS